ncbi:MAG: hypothetical protein Q4G07_11890 [Oscillospiraceae bacterium]|nr:hypothetical protein [Oscillospiraceae bacterium]
MDFLIGALIPAVLLCVIPITWILAVLCMVKYLRYNRNSRK